MNQDFPNQQQSVGSHSCGPVCLVNIFNHFGLDTDINTIFKEIHASETDSTHLPQLARHLLKQQLKTVLLSCNSYVLAPDWKDAPKSQIINQLKDWTTNNPQHDWIKESLFMLYYLEDGGELRITELTTELIDSYLETNHLILGLVEESWLWGKRKIKEKREYDPVRGNAEGHFVVIYGKTDSSYKISDPYPTGIEHREGLYTVNKQQVLTSVYLRGSQVLAIKQK